MSSSSVPFPVLLSFLSYTRMCKARNLYCIWIVTADALQNQSPSLPSLAFFCPDHTLSEKVLCKTQPFLCKENYGILMTQYDSLVLYDVCFLFPEPALTYAAFCTNLNAAGVY